MLLALAHVAHGGLCLAHLVFAQDDRVLDRLPACYFVTVSYMCWADRKAAVCIDKGGQVEWLS